MTGRNVPIRQTDGIPSGSSMKKGAIYLFNAMSFVRVRDAEKFVSTQNTVYYYYLFIIVLFCIWRTVNLLLPHPIFNSMSFALGSKLATFVSLYLFYLFWKFSNMGKRRKNTLMTPTSSPSFCNNRLMTSLVSIYFHLLCAI